jgi:hypothetical protein
MTFFGATRTVKLSFFASSFFSSKSFNQTPNPNILRVVKFFENSRKLLPVSFDIGEKLTPLLLTTAATNEYSTGVAASSDQFEPLSLKNLPTRTTHARKYCRRKFFVQCRKIVCSLPLTLKVSNILVSL